MEDKFLYMQYQFQASILHSETSTSNPQTSILNIKTSIIKPETSDFKFLDNLVCLFVCMFAQGCVTPLVDLTYRLDVRIICDFVHGYTGLRISL